MPGENADILRQSQIGVQNTLFTAVAANVLLQSVDIVPKPIHENEMLYSKGDKAALAQVSTKGSHTQAKMTGFGAYNDLCYILPTLLKAATISTPAGATTARDWSWTLLTRSLEIPKFLTVENGLTGVDASRFADGNLLGLKIGFEQKKAVAVSGDMIGTLLSEEDVTLTANPTEVPLVPISVNLMDAYVADTLGGLSTGLLGAMYKCDLSIGDRRSALFPIRKDRPSWGGVVETRNKCTAHLEIEHDSQSYQLMRQMRNGRTRYLRFSVQGPEIEPGFRYEFEYTMAFKVTSPDRGPIDEVYGGMYDLEAVHDAALGGFASFRIRAALATLAAGTNLGANEQPNTQVGSTVSASYGI